MIRTLILRYQLSRGYARQRIVREARAEAARQGASKAWKRRRERAREVFG